MKVASENNGYENQNNMIPEKRSISLVERLKSLPSIQFVPAKIPDAVSLRPASYVSLNTQSKNTDTNANANANKHNNNNNNNNSKLNTNQNNTNSSSDLERPHKKQKQRPSNLAEALSAYSAEAKGPSPIVSNARNSNQSNTTPLSPSTSNGTSVSEDSGDTSSTDSEDEIALVDYDFFDARTGTTDEDDNDDVIPRKRNISNVIISSNNANKEKHSNPYITTHYDNDHGTANADAGVDADSESDYSDSSDSSDGSDTSSVDSSDASSRETKASTPASSQPSLDSPDTGLATPPIEPGLFNEMIKPKADIKATELQSLVEVNKSSSRVVKSWKRYKSLRPLGLNNYGVNCYMNSVIQAIVHIPAMTHYLDSVYRGNYDDIISPKSVTKVMAGISNRMWNIDNKIHKRYISPQRLLERLDDINCTMSIYEQEDSHEFFISLISRIQEDSVPRGKKLNSSIIYDIFAGSLDQSVICKSCGHVSKTEQDFYDLSIDMNLSIEKSLTEYFRPEILKPDTEQTKSKDNYQCEKCHKRSSITKFSLIKKLPETLILHVKRFKFNGNGNSSKLKETIDFPNDLNLKKFTIYSSINNNTTNNNLNDLFNYKLSSVVVHEGRTTNSGHYISHCKQPDGTWATYDDEYFQPIKENNVLTEPSAYLLIYSRM